MADENRTKFLDALKGVENSGRMRDVVRRADMLIGADDLKEFIKRSVSFYEHSSGCESVVRAALSRMYILSVNLGDGIRTQTELIADLLGVMGNTDTPEIQYFTLKIPDMTPRYSSMELKTERDFVLADIEDMGLLKTGRKRLCCIDISAWIDRVESAEFRAVISRLRERMYDQFVVFRVPAVDEITLGRICEAIGWYVNVDDIYTPPFTVDQYFEYGLKRLEKLDCRLDEGALSVFRNCIVSCRTDRAFMGFKTVRNLIDEMIFTALTEGENTDVQ